MPKNKKKNKSIERSDIPYAQRLQHNKLAEIAAHRDAAHLIELKLSLLSLNEIKGMGYVQLSRYAALQQKNREEYYSDPEYMSAKLDEAVRKLGFIVEDGRLICAVDEAGKIVPTKTLQEVAEK